MIAHPWGQCFLQDESLARAFVNTAGVFQGCRVLEMGPGHGELTKHLLDAGAVVFACEVDPALVKYLDDRFSAQREAGTLVVCEGDIRGAEHKFVDVVDDWVRQGQPDVKFVSNPPYDQTDWLLKTLPKYEFSSITSMLTLHHARMLANLQQGRRGRWKPLLNRYRARLVASVPPDAFMPRPVVMSGVVHLARV